MAAKKWSSDLTPEARHLLSLLCAPVAARPCYRDLCPETSVLEVPTCWARQILLTVPAESVPSRTLADPCCPLLQAQLTLWHFLLCIFHLRT